MVNANTTEYIIGNLERDREYLVKVSACNSNSGKDKDRKCSDSASQYIKLSNPSGKPFIKHFLDDAESNTRFVSPGRLILGEAKLSLA